MTPEKPQKVLTACRHCRQQFSAYPFGMPTAGEAPSDRLAKFVFSVLGEHLNGKHHEIMKSAGQTVQLFTGLLIVNQFDTQDAGLDARTNAIRGEIHRRTRKHYVTDAAILDLVSRIGLDPDPANTVAALMRGMRDAYEETGEFSPEKQAEHMVVLA
jgi:hypothetical protein